MYNNPNIQNNNPINPLEILTRIKEDGINLQLYITDILRKHKWNCSVDRLYTDDEEHKTREIDVSCHKAIRSSLIIPKNFFKKRQHEIVYSLFGSPIKTPVQIYLSIECKYIKHTEGWFFIASSKKFEKNSLYRVIKRFPNKTFSYFTLKNYESFRETENIPITETAIDIHNSNKKNIRDSLLSTIKNLIFLLRKNRGMRSLSITMWTSNNKIINKILPGSIKKFFSTTAVVPILEIFYPIVVIDGDLLLYDPKTEKYINKNHIIINQKYLPKTFLNVSDIKKISQAGYEDEIDFYVDFVKKKYFDSFLKKLENEISLIIQVTNEALNKEPKDENI